MRRKNTQNISEILKQVTREANIDQKLGETQIIENWNKLLGPGVANSTQKLYIINKTLFVHIDSSVVRHELFMMRSQILEALNKSVGFKAIENILFR